MKEIIIKLGERSYKVVVGVNLREKINEEIKRLTPSSLLLITDKNLYPLYGRKIEEICSQTPFFKVLLPPGEKGKNLKWVMKIYTQAIKNNLDRDSVFLTLGGGSVGDTGGFSASTYLRGVRYIQLPTTLLSMVDSSIGGKTGVDFLAKNIVGTFYQPSSVIADIRTLETLPLRTYKNGIAEVVKYGFIKDGEILQILEKKKKEILGKDEEVLEEIITRSVRIKGEIVEKDEKEKGLRAILNFGHTLGHAIEYASRFKIWHGEAVSLGMIGALYISWQMGITGKENLERLERILKIYELPTRWKGKDYEALYPLLLKDKKRKEGKIKFVLLRNIGETEIRDDVPEELIRETLYYLQK